MINAQRNVDLDAVRELAIYAENHGELYESQAWPTVKNLARKVVAGSYDHDRAAVLWTYTADTAARWFTRDHDVIDGRGPFGCFSPATRREVGRELANRYAESVAFEAGEAIGPAVVRVTLSGWSHDTNGNKTARVDVDGIPAGKRRVQVGYGPDCGEAWHTGLKRAGYLPGWYTVANVDGSPGGGMSSPDPVVTITLHRRAIVVGPWTSPAGDPSYG